MRMTVNEILSLWPQNPCSGGNNRGVWLVLEFLYRLWDRSPRDARRREEELYRQQNERDREAEEKDRKDRDDVETLLLFWLASEEYRRAVESLANDVDDATTAVRLAFERAQAEQEDAYDALRAAKAGAITLRDGRRVYFSADGLHLYDEDRQEITDTRSTSEGLLASRQMRGSTTFEDYVHWEDRFEQSSARVKTLGDALDQLHDIHEQLTHGGQTADDLTRLRQEQQAILEGLPADARADYEALREARHGARPVAHHALDAEVERALALTEHFSRAVNSPLEPVDVDPVPNRAPAYKSAPDF